MTTEQALVALIGFELSGAAPGPELRAACAEDGWKRILRLAQRHSLAHLAADAMEKTGVLPDGDARQEAGQYKYLQIMRSMQLDDMAARIAQVLTREKIAFLPLKGSVLKRYYPEPWMRSSVDIDILVRRADMEHAAQALVRELSFTARAPGKHDMSLFCGTVHLELHFDLIEEGRANNASAVLSRVWEMSEIADGGCCMRMPDELFYFYQLAHMAKHLEVCGSGMRGVLDVWVLNHRVCFDRAARARLLEEGGLTQFAEKLEALAECWFSGAPETPELELLGAYILGSATFGTASNRAAITRSAGSESFLFSRAFPSYEQLCRSYPALRGHRAQTPIYWAKRLGGLLRPRLRRKAMDELRANRSLGREEIDEAGTVLRLLGLQARRGPDGSASDDD